MTKEKLGVKKRGRSIYQDQAGLNNSKKRNKKKEGKSLMVYSLVYFSLVIEAFRISASLIPF